MNMIVPFRTARHRLPAEPPAHRLEVVGYDRDAGHVVLRESVGPLLAYLYPLGYATQSAETRFGHSRRRIDDPPDCG